MSRPMKDSGMEWLGEIPENWIAIKTKFLLGKSGIKIGPFGSALKSDEISSQGPIKVYGQANLIRNDFEYGEKFIDMAKFNSLSVYEIEKEDILISMMGTIGKCSIFPPEAKRGIMDSHLTKLNLNKEKIHSEYFRYAFSGSDSTKTQLDLYSKGSIMSGLNSTIIKNILIPLPTLAEQQKIIAFLDEKTSQIDSIIENTKQSIVEFKKYKQALITETVTKGLNPDVKMKDSGIEWIGEIPEHWEVNKLKMAGSFFSAGVDKKIRENENLYRSVHYTDVYYNSLKQIKNNEDYLVISATEDKAHKSNLLKGDVLFTTSSETPEDIGHSTVVEEDLSNTLMGYHLIRFRSDNGMVLSYKKYAFGSSHLRNWFAYRANGMTRYGLKVVDFLDAPYIITPQEEQRHIADFLDEKCAHIDSLIADKEKLIGEFEDYKKALIYEYVTGKKEVE